VIRRTLAIHRFSSPARNSQFSQAINGTATHLRILDQNGPGVEHVFVLVENATSMLNLLVSREILVETERMDESTASVGGYLSHEGTHRVCKSEIQSES
jgi:hypothetical protein